MRIILLTLVLLTALAAWAGQTPAQTAAAAEPIERAFGVTLGEPLPLSSKQVLAVKPPASGLERYRLLYTPASRPPYAYYFATVAKKTRRVAAMTAQTRKQDTKDKALETFLDQVKKLESTYGPGMRLGGGNLWKLKRSGHSITLELNPVARTVSLRLADDRRMSLAGRPR